MPIQKLTAGFAVTGQMTPADIETAARDGYRTIINNRPDNETEGQPTSADLEGIARQCGLEYHHIPVVPNQITPDVVQTFDDAVREAEAPILAFCGSGKRAAMMWEAAGR